MQRRVVITGIGPVTSNGIGRDEFWENAIKLKTNIREIPEAYKSRYNFKSRFYVPAPQINASEYGIHESMDKIMEQGARFSVIGAKLALLDAGFTVSNQGKSFFVEGLDDCNCFVIIGTGIGGIRTALHSYMAHMSDKNSGMNENDFKYNRMLIPMMMPNSAASWVSILFGIKGASYTINASCASGSVAIGEAYRKIKEGICNMAITGGAEGLAEENGSIMRGFDILSTLTRTEDGRPMPFSKKRSGFLFNEGASCILVLEELEKAKSRGAKVYAEVCGFESNSDSYSIAQMDPSGEQIASLFHGLIKDRKIDYINAHGTGTIPNDDIEAKVIQNIFGNIEQQPVINSTKGLFGHSIGAGGAIEAAVTALSIKESKIHGNLSEDIMDNLNIPIETIDKEIQYAVSTSYGFGGHNAALRMKRF